MPEKNPSVYSKAPNLFNLLGGEEKITFSETPKVVDRFGMKSGTGMHSAVVYEVYRDVKNYGELEVYSNPDALQFTGELDDNMRDHILRHKAKGRRLPYISNTKFIVVLTEEGRQDGWVEIPFP